MSTQTILNFERPPTAADRFHEFHANNAQVADTLELLAAQMIDRGRKHFGIGLLFEVLRWNFYMTTTDANSDFKVNNNYRSHYARLLIARPSAST